MVTKFSIRKVKSNYHGHILEFHDSIEIVELLRELDFIVKLMDYKKSHTVTENGLPVEIFNISKNSFSAPIVSLELSYKRIKHNTYELDFIEMCYYYDEDGNFLLEMIDDEHYSVPHKYKRIAFEVEGMKNIFKEIIDYL